MAATPTISVLLALDLSVHDKAMLNFLENNSTLKAMDKLFAVHVLSHQLPNDFPSHLFDILPSVEEAQDHIQNLVVGYIDETKIPLEIIIKEGNITDCLLEVVDEKGIDLVVVGQKSKTESSGITLRKLLRESKCSLLILPESCQKIQSVLNLTDFSERSHEAFKFALGLSEELGVEIQVLHLYQAHFSYLRASESLREMQLALKSRSYERFEELKIKKSLTNRVTFHALPLDQKSMEEEIREFANKMNGPLIVMASKGQTASATVLLGSIAEAVAMFNIGFPLLIVKRKGEQLGLIDQLTSLF